MTANMNVPPRSHPARRKSSFSGALNKITSTTFNRHRTPSSLPRLTSTIGDPRRSHLPTPSGIPRSTSFLSSLSNFNSRNANRPHGVDSPATSDQLQPREDPACDPRKQSYATQRMASQAFSVPSALSRRRNSSVKIEHRGLMQPMHPPLPKSNTMAILPTIHSSPPQSTPSRPTRRSDALETPRPEAFAPAAETVGVRRPAVPLPGNFPVRKDSLVPLHARTNANLQHCGVGSSLSSTTLPESSQTVTESSSRQQGPPSLPANGGGEMGSVQSNLAKSFTRSKSDLSLEERVYELDFALEGEKCDQSTDGANDEMGKYDPCLIHSRQPPAYWLGRYVSLSDTLRSDALPVPPSRTISPNPPFQINPARKVTDESSSNLTTKTLSGGESASTKAYDHLHPMHDSTRRDKRVFILLRDMCVTEEAKESLAGFAGLMAEALEARRGQQSDVMKGIQRSIGDDWGVKEKKGWLEGLMGRRKGSK